MFPFVNNCNNLNSSIAGRTNVNTNLNEGGNGSFNEEATCESSLISTRNSSIDSQVQTQQIGNFQMKPKSSPNRLVAETCLKYFFVA